MSPFWWSYSRALNDNVVTYDLLNYRRFTEQIPWNKLTNLSPIEAESSAGDVYAMGSDQLVFGWAVNADADMTGKTITLPDLGKGKYTLKLYHTWRGRFLQDENDNEEWTVESKGKSVSFDTPVHKVTGGHARHIGQDIAFILTPIE